MTSLRIYLRLKSHTNLIAFSILLIALCFSGCQEDEVPSPSITSISPTTGVAGTSVTINGTNFDEQAGNNEVKLNGSLVLVHAATKQSLQITIPAGATTGKISVTVRGKTAISPTDLIIYTKVEITSFTPTEGVAGTNIQITGAGFSNVTTNNQVKIGGVLATVVAATESSLTVQTPASGATGLIELTTNVQTVATTTPFTYLPKIESLSTTETHFNGLIKITGSGFGAAKDDNHVTINNVPVSVEQASTTEITIRVPENASDGAVVVTVGGHAATGPVISLVKEAMGGGGDGYDVAYGVVTDNAGNIYTVGSFQNSAQFGAFTLSGQSEELFIVKYDNFGNEVWAKSAGGSGPDRAVSVAIDHSGNLFITGYASGDAAFGSIVLSGGHGAFVAKVSPNGNFEWVKLFENTGGDSNSINDVSTDSHENPIVTGHLGGNLTIDGHTVSVGGQSNTIVAKLSSTDGEVEWITNFTGTKFNGGGAIAVAPNDEIYLGGSYFSTVSIGDQTFNAPADDLDAYLTKLDATGEVIWAKAYAGNGWSNIYDIVADDNNAVVTGYFGSTLSGSGISVTGSGYENVFVAKVSPSGSAAWITVGQASSAYANGRSIAMDDDGNIFVSGYFEGTMTTGANVLAGAVNDRNVFVEKLNSSGSVQWSRKAGSNDSDWGQGLTVDSRGRILATGSFRASDGIFGSTTLHNAGGDDAFLWRIWQGEQ